MSQVPAIDRAPVDRRPAPQARRERQVVAGQLRRWLAERGRAGVRALEDGALARVNDRRALCGAPRIEEDSGALVVPGRVVVRTGDVDRVLDDAARGRLRREGLFPVTVPGVQGVRLLEEVAGPRRRRTSTDTLDLVRRALGTGVEVAPVHVFPLSAVYKADGGPEMSGPQEGEPEWTRPVEEVRGPRVALIDTGVSIEQRSDGWLTGLARTDNLDLLDVVPADDLLDLAAGHGQFCAGVVQQVAPGVDLDVRRGLSTDGYGDEVALAELIVAAAASGARIVNLSLGAFTNDDRPPLLLATALREALAEQPDLLVVCAAGNHGSDRPCWPAAFHGDPEFAHAVVSVAGLHREEDGSAVGAAWSGRGGWVECSTFAEGVVSTYVIGTESRNHDSEPEVFGPAAWATWTGTSFAAPQIVGAVVQLMQDDAGLTPRQALDQLLKGGTAITGYGTAIGVLPV
jgi:thermitase